MELDSGEIECYNCKQVNQLKQVKCHGCEYYDDPYNALKTGWRYEDGTLWCK